MKQFLITVDDKQLKKANLDFSYREKDKNFFDDNFIQWLQFTAFKIQRNKNDKDIKELNTLVNAIQSGKGIYVGPFKVQPDWQNIKDEFYRQNEKNGWDASIDFLDKFNKDEDVKTLCAMYWDAYKVMKKDDPDDGLCFEIRQFAIQQIMNIMEGWL